MKGPCQWCGAPYVVREYIDGWTRQILRQVDDHECGAWEPKSTLDATPTDTAFIRGNTEEGLSAYRDWLERQR